MATQTHALETPEALVARLAEAGRAAQRQLARLTDAQKAQALRAAASALRAAEPEILAANARDVAAGEANGLTGAMLSRAILAQANLSATELLGVDLSDCCDLDAANLQNAQVDNDTQWPNGFKQKKHGLINRQGSGLRKISSLVSAIFN